MSEVKEQAAPPIPAEIDRGAGKEPQGLEDPRLLDGILSVSEDLIQVHDLSTLLDKILLECRRFTGAEAGSIYLVEGNLLRFSFVHNEVLFKGLDSRLRLYENSLLPIDETSLCGYAALTSRQVSVADAYDLPADAPYHFNPSFDQASGYRTRSVLVTPMISGRRKVVGVLQIINARDELGQARPFTPRHLAYVTFLANNAALAVERSLITRELILRTVRMAQLRDPKETGPHVNRVGAVAAEIYARWAEMTGVAKAEAERQQDIMRVAAMLHDVGKVAIPDSILKKPGPLSDEEFRVMRLHTIHGAQLFDGQISELDAACQEIALHHHERWDGQGFPGVVEDVNEPGPLEGPGQQGEQISLMSRIVALADVHDALSSARVYKQAWPEERVLEYLRLERGRAFDPQVLDAFLSIYDVVRGIGHRYPDMG